MSKTSSDDTWVSKTRKLTQMLIISGTLNIALLATFVYSLVKNNQVAVPIALEPIAMEKGAFRVANEQLLQAYSLLPFSDLLLRLEGKELVEDGYTTRDLALACLVAFHHFNVERALGGGALQKRYIPFRSSDNQEQIPLTIFPGLADFQYEAIQHFARSEKWPFTPQGLFFEIQRTLERDPTLLEAFYLTPHFHTVNLLFTRSGFRIDKKLLVEMLAQGSWTTLNNFTEEQRRAQDLSPEKCRQFLVSYIEGRSPLAARVLLEIDLEFVSKRLGDFQLLTLFDLLPLNAPNVAPLAKELIVSPRCDAIWKRAASLLYTIAAEPVPEPYDHLRTLERFAAHALPPLPIPPPPRPFTPISSAEPQAKPAKGRRVHTIQVGDSLWKIAKKYKVTVEALKRQNRLESEKLRIGKQLEIPE
ncbi:MAG: LysM peptidoglycan-binding domain-containing protein [Chlamydiales bacterium]